MASVGVEFATGRDSYTENAFSGMGDTGGVGGNTGISFGFKPTTTQLYVGGAIIGVYLLTKMFGR